MRSPFRMLARMQDNDDAVVTQQIGRPTRGAIAVVRRCVYGLPVVIRTSPRLDDGTPFPTLYYLTCPVAVREIGRLEATGQMRRYNELLDMDDELRADYEAAHERYKAQRDAIEDLGDTQTAGGMPTRVKCLHALYAHERADANPIGASVAEQIEPLPCPGACVRGDPPERVTAHPGFKKNR